MANSTKSAPVTVFATAADAFRATGEAVEAAANAGCVHAIAEFGRRMEKRAAKKASAPPAPASPPVTTKPVGFVKAKIRAAREAREAGTTAPPVAAPAAVAPDLAAIVAAVMAAMGHTAPVAAPRKGKSKPAPVVSDVPELGALTPDEAADCSTEELRELAEGGASAALRRSAAEALRLRTEPDVATLAARLQALELANTELRAERDSALAEGERLAAALAKKSARKAAPATAAPASLPLVSAAPSTATTRKSRTAASSK